jgi:hypothetical protein
MTDTAKRGVTQLAIRKQDGKKSSSGVMKIIKIDNDELTDFVNNAKATFGAFQVRLDDGHKHYFLISINF